MQNLARMLHGILLLAMLLTATTASATSCASRRYDANEAQQLFGPAEVVFIGRLEKLGGARQEAWYQSAEGSFTTGEIFKGKPDTTASIRVDADLVAGHDYLVFARRDKTELRADAVCFAGTQDLANTFLAERLAEQLAWLRAPPAPGSGGSVDVFLREDSPRQIVADTTLKFESPAGAFSIRADKDGAGHATQVKAGTYHLITAAPAGFRYVCYPDCESLIVHDRGREEFAVQLHALAKLTVEIVDAAGQPIDLHAQFELYEPRSGRLVGPLGWESSYFLLGDDHAAAAGELRPGRYVVGLVLPEFDEDKLSPKVTDKIVVFDHGAAQVQQALVVDVHEGDNVARFHLPKALQPVRTELHFNGEHLNESMSMSALQLLLGQTIGGWSSDAHCRLGGDGDDQTRTFFSIPGQNLRLNLYGYLIDGHKDTLRLRPMHDEVLDLQLTKQ